MSGTNTAAGKSFSALWYHYLTFDENGKIINGGDDYEILFTGPNGLDKKKNVTKIGKMTGDNKINLIDFDDSISLEGYKHEI